ncbi:hypothetical protein Tco_0953061 [Tanacetum coccineum]|uniref:Uncharacterized protein n=1 Tax=Tanacetum coccineum TaxID=301880 RepID=A0ABQ5DYS0_9ASTR
MYHRTRLFSWLYPYKSFSEKDFVVEMMHIGNKTFCLGGHGGQSCHCLTLLSLRNEAEESCHRHLLSLCVRRISPSLVQVTNATKAGEDVLLKHAVAIFMPKMIMEALEVKASFRELNKCTDSVVRRRVLDQEVSYGSIFANSYKTRLFRLAFWRNGHASSFSQTYVSLNGIRLLIMCLTLAKPHFHHGFCTVTIWLIVDLDILQQGVPSIVPLAYPNPPSLFGSLSSIRNGIRLRSNGLAISLLCVSLESHLVYGRKIAFVPCELIISYKTGVLRLHGFAIQEVIPKFPKQICLYILSFKDFTLFVPFNAVHIPLAVVAMLSTVDKYFHLINTLFMSSSVGMFSAASNSCR